MTKKIKWVDGLKYMLSVRKHEEVVGMPIPIKKHTPGTRKCKFIKQGLEATRRNSHRNDPYIVGDINKTVCFYCNKNENYPGSIYCKKCIDWFSEVGR